MCQCRVEVIIRRWKYAYRIRPSITKKKRTRLSLSCHCLKQMDIELEKKSWSQKWDWKLISNDRQSYFLSRINQLNSKWGKVYLSKLAVIFNIEALLTNVNIQRIWGARISTAVIGSFWISLIFESKVDERNDTAYSMATTQKEEALSSTRAYCSNAATLII